MFKFIRKLRTARSIALQAEVNKLSLIRLRDQINLSIQDDVNRVDIRSFSLIEQKVGNLMISGSWVGRSLYLDIVDTDVMRRSKATLGKIAIIVFKGGSHNLIRVDTYRHGVRVKTFSDKNRVEMTTLINVIDSLAPGQLRLITKGF